MFALVFLAFVACERAYERRYSRQALRGERKVTWIYRALDLLLMAIYALSGLEHFLLRRRLQWPVTVAALAIFGGALVLRNVAIRTLGKFWSLHVEIRQEHVLITDGIYRHIRHPAYLAIMMEMVSIPLALASYYTATLALCVYVPLLLIRWRREELEMIGKFGDQYRQYCKRVPAFLPFGAGLQRPEKSVGVTGVQSR